jgi:YidC/Oxa1 family membrane protein insertase
MRLVCHWIEYRKFQKLAREDRQIVFYSESAQDWHHFEPVINHLTGSLQRSIDYVASDETDPGLHQENPRIRAFCIGSGALRTLLFQFLHANVVVMTMIDLGNLQLKRSIHPVHYVFVFHSLISTHMTDYEDSYDHYDSILCGGPHHIAEFRRREALKGLAPKNLIEQGYPRLEHLMALGETQRRTRSEGGQVQVLLAPSWGDQCILETCGGDLISILLESGYGLTLRPHYQTRLLTPRVLEALETRFAAHPRFTLVEYMGENQSLLDSDIMISDWSGAAIEYALGLEKPVLYIDVPRKTRNDQYQTLGIEPIEAFIRDRIGAILAPDQIQRSPQVIADLLQEPARFRQSIAEVRAQWVFNLGTSAAVGAENIARIADGRATAE